MDVKKNPFINNTLGMRIKDSLKEKGWSQKNLSEATGIPTSTISYWCRDQSSPPIAELRAMADHLGVNMEWLESGTGERYSTPDAVACSLDGKVVGDVLQDLIETRLKLSVDEAAQRMGVSVAELDACLGSRSAPKWEMLQKLLGELGVSVDYLLRGSGPEIIPRTELDRVKLALGIRDDWNLAKALGIETEELSEHQKSGHGLPAPWLDILLSKYGLNPAWVQDGTYPTHADVRTSYIYKDELERLENSFFKHPGLLAIMEDLKRQKGQKWKINRVNSEI